MRPELLNPLFASAQTLPGVGPKLVKTLAKLLGVSDSESREARVADLVWHLPSNVIDRSSRPLIADAPHGEIATLEVTVGQHRRPPRHNRRVPYKVLCSDESGTITLVFFHAHNDYLARQLPEGQTRFVSGKVEWFNNAPQIVHPDYIVSPDEFAKMPLIEPVYPMTAGLSPKTLNKAISAAVDLVPALPEWQDESWHVKQHWDSFERSIHLAHAPGMESDLSPLSPARARIAYDELLANQLALALVRKQMKRVAGRSLAGTGELRAHITGNLPFSLTGAQSTAIDEILHDMASDERMLRLLQGDVGAGKTIVALAALATAVESGAQGAFMAPTEILARQHLETLRKLAEPAGVRIEILTGRDQRTSRRAVLAELAKGGIDILVGTHAIFQEGVEFANLGLAVIDEQHRFGVHQRLAIQAKAAGKADVLVMTATPIPRTLALTYYGDMDVSRLTEKPAGRTPIDTRVLPAERIGDVLNALPRALAKGARVYWVCPLVEENEEMGWAAAEERQQALERLFPGQTGLIHGRMKGSEKDSVMERFQSGDISILIATTVIEVGVDVPEATIMVVENAERFGLSQLHQLRGRVGRGTEKSSCLLLYAGHLSESAKARLKIMRETDDGFLIAEEDLRLRGSGELLGVRQSGAPAFKIADLTLHGELLAAARDDTTLILEQDPHLNSPRGAALRILLYLFERDEAIRLLSAG
ncbi:MAG: ATP-dependent DNA helicase RecG [Hyphomicrobiales bacterium]